MTDLRGKNLKGILTRLLEETDKQNNRIRELELQCSALESIQGGLLTILSSTNAQAHSKILDEIQAALSNAEEKGLASGAAVDYLRSLLQKNTEKKVSLYLVPKKTAPSDPTSPSDL